ncbi:hypothetical protein [Chryseobacterium chendengshani]|uniref:hypothetical protein n=1 Tax=Chryseobacterium sp. LJ756 TaxID=2864113 RepID=UPI001C64254E|nr:hypothetical protein [Chryseobacterium sp. LJ756]MBW7675270.1 hypothetical protein [Chryseobacterium sp. LJ756]
MKTSKMVLIISLIFGLGILIVFLLRDNSKKEIKILDCKVLYTVEELQPGFIDFSESNAKKEVGICLCEKYLSNREQKYKVEILKLYNSVGMIYPSFEKGNKIDSVCNNRTDVFFKQFNL